MCNSTAVKAIATWRGEPWAFTQHEAFSLERWPKMRPMRGVLETDAGPAVLEAAAVLPRVKLTAKFKVEDWIVAVGPCVDNEHDYHVWPASHWLLGASAQVMLAGERLLVVENDKLVAAVMRYTVVSSDLHNLVLQQLYVEGLL